MKTPSSFLLTLLTLAPISRGAVPVDELLAKLPAPSIEEGAALIQQLSAEGPAVVIEVARRLKPSDVDPTPAPRFALQGLTAMYGRAETPAAMRAAFGIAHVNSDINADARIAYRLGDNMELSFSGFNLLGKENTGTGLEIDQRFIATVNITFN